MTEIQKDYLMGAAIAAVNVLIWIAAMRMDRRQRK